MKKITYLFAFFLTATFGSIQAQNCQADFQYWTSGLTAQFMDSTFSTSGNHTYSWTFGDGGSSTLSNPGHTYNQAGTYSVRLMIQDSLCFDSIVKLVTVTNSNPPCVAYFTSYIDSNNTAYFNNLTAPSAGLTYTWDFGDGSPYNTLVNPSHTYTTPGVYVVTLYAAGNGVVCNYTDTIHVNFCDALFYVSTNGYTANFNNVSSSARWSTGYAWDFGDGNSSNAINPSHTFTNSGVYAVTLTSFDSIGNCTSTYTDSVSISITNPSACSASFTVAKDTTSQFAVTLFNTSSTASSHQYFWDFGDGFTGQGRFPAHQYNSFGSYLVCLTIADTILNCTSTFCDTVGMDSLGNLKAASGFTLVVRNPIVVGVDENEIAEAISVYPNPAVNQVSLDLTNETQVSTVRIVDITGSVVFQDNNVNGGAIREINVANFKNGLYFIQIQNGDNTQVKKLVKTN
tara:strand:- start:957 stop:2324 length:1368 start_codon:yes stop_codon:yes gene_type:complete